MHMRIGERPKLDSLVLCCSQSLNFSPLSLACVLFTNLVDVGPQIIFRRIVSNSKKRKILFSFQFYGDASWYNWFRVK